MTSNNMAYSRKHQKTPPVRSDLPEVAALKKAAVDRGLLLLFAQTFAPGGFRDGHEWRFGNIDGSAGGRLTMALTGRHAGLIMDWPDDQAYDIPDLIQNNRGLSRREALSLFRSMLGMSVDEIAAHTPKPPTEAELREDAEKRAERVAKALKVWDSCDDITGTLAEKYLRDRCIERPLPISLRFHKALGYWDVGPDGKPVFVGKFPALVCMIQRADDSFCGIHRIYLDPGGNGKVHLTNLNGKPRSAKKMLGDADGGAIRCCDDEEVTGELGIAEGVEDALSIFHLYDGMPAWSAISAGGIRKLQLPAWVTHPVFFPDNDPPARNKKGDLILNENGQPARAGYDACTSAVHRLRSETCSPRLTTVRGRHGEKDVNALLMSEKLGVVS